MQRTFLALIFATLSLSGCATLKSNPYERMVDRVSTSVYRITGRMEGESYVCTGFAISEHRALTAAHCVGEQMWADGIPVKVLKADTEYDLALIEVPSNDRAPLVINEAPVRRFQPVSGVGYAWGLTRLTVLLERVYLIDVAPGADMVPGILAQGGYIGGMSGGPVVDDDGLVVGMVQRTNSGVGYGVGTLLIRAFLVGT